MLTGQRKVLIGAETSRQALKINWTGIENKYGNEAKPTGGRRPKFKFKFNKKKTDSPKRKKTRNES